MKYNITSEATATRAGLMAAGRAWRDIPHLQAAVDGVAGRLNSLPDRIGSAIG
ncbi:MAG: hypothetical protein ACE5G3_04535 [Gammaproteobacteria bacterium]